MTLQMTAPTHGPATERTLRHTTISNVKGQPIRWMVPGRVPYAGLTVLVGHPGLGKSQLTLGIAAGVSREGSDVLLIGAEDGVADIIRPRLLAAEADVARIHTIDPITPEGYEDMVMLPVDVELLEAKVTELGAALVVVDPFAAHLAPELNSNNDHSMRQATAPLARMARRTGCAVIIVAHFNKSREGSLLGRVGGSMGLTGAARSVLALGRHKTYDPMEKDTRYLVHLKCNGAPLADTMECEIAGRQVTDDGALIPTSRLSFLQERPEVYGSDLE